MSDQLTERTPQQVWEENNEQFNYEAPDKTPEAWSREEFTELYDRVIMRQVTWTCQKCHQPFGSVEKARRHVRANHGEQMLKKYAPREDR